MHSIKFTDLWRSNNLMYFSHEVEGGAAQVPALDARTIFLEIKKAKKTDSTDKAKIDKLKRTYIAVAGAELLSGKYYYQSEVRDVEPEMMKFASELGLKVPSFKSCMSSVGGVNIDPKAYPGGFNETAPDLSIVYSVLVSLDAVEDLEPSVRAKREEALRTFKEKTIREVKQNVANFKLKGRIAESRKDIEGAFYAIANAKSNVPTYKETVHTGIAQFRDALANAIPDEKLLQPVDEHIDSLVSAFDREPSDRHRKVVVDRLENIARSTWKYIYEIDGEDTRNQLRLSTWQSQPYTLFERVQMRVTKKDVRPQANDFKKDELISKSILQLVDGTEEVFEPEDAAYANEFFGVGAGLNNHQRAVAILSHGKWGSPFLRLQPRQLYLLLQNHPELAPVIEALKVNRNRKIRKVVLPPSSMAGAAALALITANVAHETTAALVGEHVIGVEEGSRYQVTGVESVKVLKERLELAKRLQGPFPGAQMEIVRKMRETVENVEFAPGISMLTSSNYREIRELYDLLCEMGISDDYLKTFTVDDSAGKELNLGNYKEKLAILNEFEGVHDAYRSKGMVRSIVESYVFNFDLSQDAEMLAFDEVLKGIPKNGQGKVDTNFLTEKIEKNPIIEQALYDGTVNGDVQKLVKWCAALKKIASEQGTFLRFELRNGVVASDLKFPKVIVDESNLDEIQEGYGVIQEFFSSNFTYGASPQVNGMEILDAYQASLDLSSLPRSISSEEDSERVLGVVQQINNSAFLSFYISQVDMDTAFVRRNYPPAEKKSYGGPDSQANSRVYYYVTHFVKGIHLNEKNSEMWARYADNLKPDAFALEYQKMKVTNIEEFKSLAAIFYRYNDISPDLGSLFLRGSEVSFSPEFLDVSEANIVAVFALLKAQEGDGLLMEKLFEAFAERLVADQVLKMDEKLSRFEFLGKQYSEFGYRNVHVVYLRQIVASSLDRNKPLLERIKEYESVIGEISKAHKEAFSYSSMYSTKELDFIFAGEKITLNNDEALEVLGRIVGGLPDSGVQLELDDKVTIDEAYLHTITTKEQYSHLGRVWSCLGEENRARVWEILSLKGEMTEVESHFFFDVGGREYLSQVRLPQLDANNVQWIAILTRENPEFGAKLNVGAWPASLNSSEEIQALNFVLWADLNKGKSVLESIKQHSKPSRFKDQIELIKSGNLHGDAAGHSEADQLMLRTLVDLTYFEQDDAHAILEQISTNADYAPFWKKYCQNYASFGKEETAKVLNVLSSVNLFSGYDSEFGEPDESLKLYLQVFSRLTVDNDLSKESSQDTLVELYAFLVQAKSAYVIEDDALVKMREKFNFKKLSLESRAQLAKKLMPQSQYDDDIFKLVFLDFRGARNLTELQAFDASIVSVFGVEEANSLGTLRAAVGGEVADSFDLGTTLIASPDELSVFQANLDLLEKYNLLDELVGKITVQMQTVNGVAASGAIGEKEFEKNAPLIALLAQYNGRLGLNLSGFSLNINFSLIDKPNLQKIKTLAAVFGAEAVMKGSSFKPDEQLLDDLALVHEYRSIMGNEFLYFMANIVDTMNVNPSNLDVNVDRAIKLWHFSPFNDGTGSTEDLRETYKLFAHFLVNAILNSSLSEEQKTEVYARFVEEGLIEEDPSGLVKTWQRGFSGASYLGSKAMIKASEPFHQELTQEKVYRVESKDQLDAGFKMYTVFAGAKESATLVLGEPAEGARLGLVYKQEKSTMANEVRREALQRGGRDVWQAVAPYTTGSKALGILINDGRVESNVIQFDKMDGLVIMYPENSPLAGTAPLRIIDKFSLTVGDLTGDLSNKTRLDITKAKDFIRFLDLSKRNKLSIYQQHLLMEGGDSQISQETGKTDKRRALVTFADGSFGLLSFNQAEAFSFTDMVYIADQIGATSMVNCDTGYYNMSSVRTMDGRTMELGEDSRSNETYNLVVGISTADE